MNLSTEQKYFHKFRGETDSKRSVWQIYAKKSSFKSRLYLALSSEKILWSIAILDLLMVKCVLILFTIKLFRSYDTH